MSEPFFTNYNVISYNDTRMINIMQRTAILNSVFSNKNAFYPYHVKPGMRANEVAYRYYGNVEYVWLVYMSNNIIDPYYDWLMDELTFQNFIVTKYGSIENAMNKIVNYRVNWYEDDSVLSMSQYNALHDYEKKYWTASFDQLGNAISYTRKKLDYSAVSNHADGSVTLSVPSAEARYWSSVSAYNYEEEKNMDRANIVLLDNRLLRVAEQNLRELFA